MHKWNCVLSKFWSCSPQETLAMDLEGLYQKSEQTTDGADFHLRQWIHHLNFNS